MSVNFNNLPDPVPLYEEIDFSKVFSEVNQKIEQNKQELSVLKSREWQWQAANALTIIGLVTSLALFIIGVTFGFDVMGFASLGGMLLSFVANRKVAHKMNGIDSKIKILAEEVWRCQEIIRNFTYLKTGQSESDFSTVKDTQSLQTEFNQRSNSHQNQPNFFLKVQGCEFMARSMNFGKKEDMPSYSAVQFDRNLPSLASKDRLFLRPHYSINPFGGLCLGACLFFASNYLNGQNPEMIANRFTEGVPYAAARLQGKYMAFRNGGYMAQLQEDTDGRQLSALNVSCTIHLEGLAMISQNNRLNCDQALDCLKNAQDGVYEISIPTDEKNYHALLLIKTKGETYLFDPNVGTGRINERHTIDLVHAAFTHYDVQKNEFAKDRFSIRQLAPASEMNRDVTWGKNRVLLRHN